MNDRSAEKFYILQSVFGFVVVQSLQSTSEYGTDSHFWKVRVQEQGFHAEARSYDFASAVEELFRKVEKSGKIKDAFVA